MTKEKERKLQKLIKPLVEKIIKEELLKEGSNQFERMTGLAPDIIADTVLEELEHYFKESLNPSIRDKVINDVVNKANGIVVNRDFIKKASNGTKGREFVYSFVRHWIASFLKDSFNGKRLPIGFSQGKQAPLHA